MKADIDALGIDGLGKDYGALAVVNRLNLSLAKGEFVSLLGPSGCGKTTTLRMIAGFIAPDRGTITVAGRVLSTPRGVVPPDRRGMSMIFQSYAIWPHMTVFENVAFGLRARGIGRAELRRRVGEILDVVRLGHLAARYPGEMSGGQQQRIALARAIVVRPDVLLLDEPLSNLDTALRGEMRREIRRLHDEFRITTVYVTHDLGEAMAVSDRIAVMSGGRIEQVADPATLFRRPRTRFVANFVGGSNILTARRSGTMLHFAGFSLPACACTLTDGASGTFSLRARTMSLHREASAGAPAVPCRVLARAYAGDFWEYDLACGVDGAILRLDAPPGCDLQAGETGFVAIDPAELVQVEDEEQR